jgi:hypothetical protein
LRGGGGVLDAVQLTIDQKPEDADENERIVAANGFVSRLTDPINKQKAGPFRVWKDQDGPGLAMSRSIGDSVGH